MPPAQPTAAALNSFIDRARGALPKAQIENYRTRCIGWNQETSESICRHVRAGEKRGTFSVPWLWAAHPNTKPEIGQFVVLSTYDGVPQALLQVKQLTLTTFKEIDASHTGLDGPLVRDLGVWRGVHTKYWNDLLGPLGKKVEDDMAVVVERFECVYPKP